MAILVICFLLLVPALGNIEKGFMPKRHGNSQAEECFYDVRCRDQMVRAGETCSSPMPFFSKMTVPVGSTVALECVTNTSYPHWQTWARPGWITEIDTFFRLTFNAYNGTKIQILRFSLYREGIMWAICTHGEFHVRYWVLVEVVSNGTTQFDTKKYYRSFFLLLTHLRVQLKQIRYMSMNYISHNLVRFVQELDMGATEWQKNHVESSKGAIHMRKVVVNIVSVWTAMFGAATIWAILVWAFTIRRLRTLGWMLCCCCQLTLALDRENCNMLMHCNEDINCLDSDTKPIYVFPQGSLGLVPCSFGAPRSD
jgi:hypothetical protein